MKKIIFMLMVFAFCSNPIVAQTSDETIIEQLCNNKFNYMIQQDSIAFKNLLHNNLTYIHSSGKTDTKESIVATISKGTTIYKILQTSNLQTRVLGKTGIVTGTLRYGAETKNNYKEYNLLFTEVWVKEKKQWLLVSRHASKI